MNHLAPMNIFLRQEIDRMQKVIRNVRNTLKDLLLAIEGTIIMSEVKTFTDIDTALICIFILDVKRQQIQLNEAARLSTVCFVFAFFAVAP